MLKTEAIHKFLQRCTSPIALYYNPNMEVQINVAKDKGKREKGRYKGHAWHGWVDEETGEKWKNFRIPWNAGAKAEFRDTTMRFDLNKHAEGIGMTGWDWVNKQSLWVGYDFDAIIGHKAGLEDAVLEELIEKTKKIPWVTLLRSTGGRGIHLYLMFDEPIKTETHTEHAAIARSLLSVLTIETGFNFKATVDVCGSILWCYHRKQEGTEGLTYIKKGKSFPLSKIPPNWKDHLPVCSRKTNRTHAGKGVSTLSLAMKNFNLDNQHHTILKWISSNAKRDWWWETDYNMLVCHTLDLAECYKSLNLRGLFETNSSGSSGQNCFCFPLSNGAFIVRRHGSKTSEAKTWSLDDTGWTKCYFNAQPTVAEASISQGALENENGEFVYESCFHVAKAVVHLGLEFTYPKYFDERPVSLKIKGSKLIFKLDAVETDPKTDGFLKSKKKWVKVLIHSEEYEEVSNQDNLIRHVITNGVDGGWYICINNEWVFHPKNNVINVLLSQIPGANRNDIDQLLGRTILDPWLLVNRPFEDEYLGERLWNKDAPQLSVKPVQGKVTHWWSLLEHLGAGMDLVVEENTWCSGNGIETGSDYLMAWIAMMIRRPSEALPYLFFFGQQKTGKSTLHEALALLFKNQIGYARADCALTSKSGFNNELRNAVLCVVEETDLSHNINALNKIKDWVTGKTISIRALYTNVADVTNTTHWIQCSNDGKACPILPGDTRINAIEVDQLKEEIPKSKLLSLLEDELSAFLFEVLNYDLPEAEGRLGLPVLESEIKALLSEENGTPLDTFIQEKLTISKGHYVTFDELYSAFNVWLIMNMPNEEKHWTKKATAIKFPSRAPMVKGKFTNNLVCIGNISFDSEAEDKSFIYTLNKKTRRLEKKLC